MQSAVLVLENRRTVVQISISALVCLGFTYIGLKILAGAEIFYCYHLKCWHRQD
jgi:hypothetical protein